MLSKCKTLKIIIMTTIDCSKVFRIQIYNYMISIQTIPIIRFKYLYPKKYKLYLTL